MGSVNAIWKGAIGFGLVTIPVRLYAATEQRDVTFHQVRRSDGSRIRYRRVAEADGNEVPYAEIGKGYTLPSGETVVLTDEDLVGLPIPTQRVIDVQGFVPLDQVDPIYFAHSYYLEPEGSGIKPYALLRDALVASGRVGLVKVALRQRESLAALRVRGDVFVLETMLWPDEIRTPAFPALDEKPPIRAQELAMARSLIDTMSMDFEPVAYADGYREALEALIAAKAAGKDVVAAGSPPPEQEPAGDLLAALRQSVEQAQQRKQAPENTDATGDLDTAGSPRRRPKRSPAPAHPPDGSAAARKSRRSA